LILSCSFSVFLSVLLLQDWLRETGGPLTSPDPAITSSTSQRRNQLKSRFSMSSSYPPPSYSTAFQLSSRPSRQRQLSISSLPTFDIYCFETFFQILKSLLKQEITFLQTLINPILERFHNSSYFSFFIPFELQSSMKANTQHLSLLTHRLNRVIYSLREILDNDNNLIKINLSLFYDNPQYYQ
jgi:hypothetical protein